ncbi:uncharacterized protein PFL1_01820 [Pseudozyma flocculosa PF-1]|uniref:Fe2OG dioxygenase domain-containing protein n=1 Tax=Pseudozyma flocculosa TaxID=84751 RepID=A0A5C3F0B3_9BASI|nr:uncharacterized protein PFL1_01820 [Pseudozyma flocculosa PF-1]EPQ30922.1 hypothetical protein PFL1_01820 [Pseudozyma flocculosa PF-1]SPO36691.1 uncharacterized protein PSFLO_02162 [Pseudozyma flocculosa]
MSIIEEPSSQHQDLEAYRIHLPQHVLPSSSHDTRGPTNDNGDGDDNDSGFFYIPDFISADEEEYLINKINTAPLPKWKTLHNRRLQYWGGQVTASNVLIPQDMPDFLEKFPDLVSRLERTGAFRGSKHGRPNHCLVNEYRAGQGIMPHEDGAAYFPAVATISLGSHTLLDVYRYVDDALQQQFDKKMEQHDAGPGDPAALPRERIEGNVKVVRGARAREPEPVFSILQEPRSLLITRGRVYRDFLHGIAERTSDPAEALSKVINVGQIRDGGIQEVLAAAKASLQPPSKLMPVAKADGDGTRKTELVRDTRLSLTLRDVEKVSKGLGGLLGAMTRV